MTLGLVSPCVNKEGRRLPSTKYGESLKRSKDKEESRKKNVSEIQDEVYHHHHHHLAAVLLLRRSEAWQSCLEISTLCSGSCSLGGLTGMVKWRRVVLLPANTAPGTCRNPLPHHPCTTQPPQYKWQWVGGPAGRLTRSLWVAPSLHHPCQALA